MVALLLVNETKITREYWCTKTCGGGFSRKGDQYVQ